MLPLSINSREATFAVILMAADTQLRKRDLEGFRDNPYNPNSPTAPPKSTNLNRKPSKNS